MLSHVVERLHKFTPSITWGWKRVGLEKGLFGKVRSPGTGDFALD